MSKISDYAVQSVEDFIDEEATAMDLNDYLEFLEELTDRIRDRHAAALEDFGE